MTDYSEILLQSVQTLIDKSLESISSDRTVICTITDNTERLKGQYKASSNNNVIYTVYSDKEVYGVGEQVLVLFPQDDTKNKIILSKYITTDIQKPLAYVSPREKMIEVTDNLTSNMSGELTANGKVEIVEIGTIMSPELINSKFYDTIYLSADFTCLLSAYDIRSGNYGLLIEGYTSTAETSAPVAIMQLDSKQMFGNPYAFMAPFQQEILFHYNIGNDFKKLKVYLYQSSDFTYFDGITTQQLQAASIKLESVSTPNNIMVSNVNLRLGYDVASVIDDTAKVVFIGSLDYSKANGLNKEVELIWYNKTEDNKFLGFSDGVFSQNAKKKIGVIKTKKASDQGGFLYTLKDSSYTVYFSEQEYTEGDSVFYRNGSSLSSTRDNVILGLAEADNTSYYWIEWLVDDVNGVLSIADEGPIEKYNVACRLDLATTKAQAKVWCNGEVYASNIITFQNQDINSNNISNLGIEMVFEHIEPGYPVYALYKKNNKLMHQKDASTRRKIKAKCVPRATEVADAFWNDAIITWGIPKNATMLKPDPSLKDNEDIKAYETDDYFYYELNYSQNNLIFTYFIKEEYNQNYQNNTITCSVALPGTRGTVYGSELITFSSLGSNGTNYTFTINTVKDGFPWNSQSTTTLGLTANLRDANNAEVAAQDLKYYRVWPNNTTALPRASITQRASDINRYNLIRATCLAEWVGRDIKFEARLPIIYSKDAKYYADAPAEIIYNSLGTKESEGEAKQLKLRDIVTNEEIDNIHWRLKYQPAVGKRDESIAISFDEIVTDEDDNKIWLQDWIPQIHSQQHLIGKVLENQFVGFIGTSSQICTIGQEVKVSNNMTQGKVLIGSDSNGEFIANVLNDQNHLYKWKINEPTALTVYTTLVKNGQTWYTIFNEEIFDKDIYKVAKEHGKNSRWSPKAMSYLDSYLESHEFVEFRVGEVNRDDENIWRFTDTGDIVERAEGVDFTPGRYSTYITYKDANEEIYYFLAPVISGLGLQLGEYYRAIGEAIESSVNEYRYLLSVKLDGKNIPDKETYVLFNAPTLDSESEIYKGLYVDKAPMDKLSLGVYTTYTLSTPDMYMDTGYFCILQAFQIQANGEVILWSQPLPVSQYKYGSELLNNWNGQLKIDEGNNYVLSAMLGAGVKNDDNTFSGVIMGDTKVLDDNNRATHAIGLYGYHEGTQSFGFKVDGKAFLGKSGRGRIEFNGDTGTIKSTDENGMTIDLDDGIISAGRFTLDTHYAPPTISDKTVSDSWNKYILDTSSRKLEQDSSIVLVHEDGVYKVTKQLSNTQKRLAILQNSFQVEKDQICVISGKIKGPQANTHYLVIEIIDIASNQVKELKLLDGIGKGAGNNFKSFSINWEVEEQCKIRIGIAGYPFSNNYSSDASMKNSFAFKELNIKIKTPARSTRILLNNVDSDKDIMYIGTAANHISLNQQGALAINVQNFNLQSDGIELNSEPENGEDYIHIGDDNNYIAYGLNSSGNKVMRIASDQFKLSAGAWEDGIIILDNAATGTNYNFAVGEVYTNAQGNKISNYIRYSVTNGLEISNSNKFHLKAGNWKDGIIILDNAATGESHNFAVGKDYTEEGKRISDYICYSATRGVEISANNFALGAGSWNSGRIEIDSSGKNGYYFAAGKDDNVGSVGAFGHNGESYLTIGSSGIEIKTPNFWLKNSGGIEMTGTINATGGSIGGWQLTKGTYNNVDYSSLTSGTDGESGFIGLYTAYPGNANHRLKIGTRFSVDKDGVLTCSGAVVNGKLQGVSFDTLTTDAQGTITLGSISLRYNSQTEAVGNSVEIMKTGSTLQERGGLLVGYLSSNGKIDAVDIACTTLTVNGETISGAASGLSDTYVVGEYNVISNQVEPWNWKFDLGRLIERTKVELKDDK